MFKKLIVLFVALSVACASGCAITGSIAVERDMTTPRSPVYGAARVNFSN